MASYQAYLLLSFIAVPSHPCHTCIGSSKHRITYFTKSVTGPCLWIMRMVPDWDTNELKKISDSMTRRTLLNIITFSAINRACWTFFTPSSVQAKQRTAQQRDSTVLSPLFAAYDLLTNAMHLLDNADDSGTEGQEMLLDDLTQIYTRMLMLLDVPAPIAIAAFNKAKNMDDEVDTSPWKDQNLERIVAKHVKIKFNAASEALQVDILSQGSGLKWLGERNKFIDRLGDLQAEVLYVTYFNDRKLNPIQVKDSLAFIRQCTQRMRDALDTFLSFAS